MKNKVWHDNLIMIGKTFAKKTQKEKRKKKNVVGEEE